MAFYMGKIVKQYGQSGKSLGNSLKCLKYLGGGGGGKGGGGNSAWSGNLINIFLSYFRPK